jgi:hypothetical protein
MRATSRRATYGRFRQRSCRSGSRSSFSSCPCCAVGRFAGAAQVAAYVGLVPRERSPRERQWAWGRDQDRQPAGALGVREHQTRRGRDRPRARWGSRGELLAQLRHGAALPVSLLSRERTRAERAPGCPRSRSRDVDRSNRPASGDARYGVGAWRRPVGRDKQRESRAPATGCLVNLVLPGRCRLVRHPADTKGTRRTAQAIRNPRRGLKALCRKGSRAADHDLTMTKSQIHRRRTRLRPQRQFGAIAHARAAHALNVGNSSKPPWPGNLTKRGGRRLVPYPPTSTVRLESASAVLATTSFTLVEVGAGR